MIERPSPNHEPRPPGTPIDMLVLHYTGMKTAGEALARLCDPTAKVSAHYLIDEDGTTYRLVEESRRAWHAGAAMWRGESDVNSRSIGIELVNPGHEFGYRDFPKPQMAALIALARVLLSRHPIPAGNVVGHSDVAPSRKTDPGERFDWRGLAQAGIGQWPKAAEPSAGEPLAKLARYGYDTRDAEAAIQAFQRRFRPTRIDGILDAECCALLDGLLAQGA